MTTASVQPIKSVPPTIVLTVYVDHPAMVMYCRAVNQATTQTVATVHHPWANVLQLYAEIIPVLHHVLYHS